MSTIVYTKAAEKSTQNDFESLCERCCWPTLRHGELQHALVYPEEALQQGTWKQGQAWMPRHQSVFRTAQGSIACDSDFSRLKLVSVEIYKALNGEKAELPRPTAAFCQKFALSRHQEKLKADGISSDLVQDEVNGEWCLDVEMPETERSLEVSLS